MRARLTAVVLFAAALGACRDGGSGGGGAAAPAGGPTIALMPKNKGNPYFVSCRQGAEEAARQLGVTLLWDGPTETDAAKQNEVVEAWITRGVDAIAVSVENREDLHRVAQGSGPRHQGRDLGRRRPARRARPVREPGDPTRASRRRCSGTPAASWRPGRLRHRHRLPHRRQPERVDCPDQAAAATKYPGLRLVDIRPSDDDRKRAFDETQALLKAHPEVKLVVAIASPAVPGAAEAVKQSGRSDVKVTGLGLPNDARPYLKHGVVDSVVLWNTADLGYLTVRVAAALVKGTLAGGASSFDAGRLGSLRVEGDNVLLGTPFTFTKDNVDQFDF